MMGFDVVYRSRASRGALDLLALRGSHQLGLPIKRSQLPLRFTLAEWSRLEAESQKSGWQWIVTAVLPPPENTVLFLDPTRVRKKKEARLTRDAMLDNLLLWLERPHP